MSADSFVYRAAFQLTGCASRSARYIFPHPRDPGEQNPLRTDNFEEAALNKVNIQQEFEQVKEYWCQRTIGVSNGQMFKLAKGTGSTNWHKHDDQDELFIVYKGHLTIQLRDRNIELLEGEMFIVPTGVEHCPVANGEVHLLVVGSSITSTKAGGKPN